MEKRSCMVCEVPLSSLDPNYSCLDFGFGKEMSQNISQMRGIFQMSTFVLMEFPKSNLLFFICSFIVLLLERGVIPSRT